MSDASPKRPTKASLRKLLLKVLPMDIDVDAFCGDHFEDVSEHFSEGMSPLKKIDTLLRRKEPDEILQKLREHGSEDLKKHESLLAFKPITLTSGKPNSDVGQRRPLAPPPLVGEVVDAIDTDAIRSALTFEYLQVVPPSADFSFAVAPDGQLSWPTAWSPEHIVSAWGDPGSLNPRPLNLTVMFPFFDCPDLGRALLRLGFHGGISVLTVPDPLKWFEQAGQLVSDCLGILDESWKPIFASPNQTARTTRWSLSQGGAAPSKIFENLSSHIEDKMDLWVLRALSLELEEVFNDNLNKYGLEVAHEFLGPMRELWTEWEAMLKPNAELRRSFLSGIVSAGESPSRHRPSQIARRARVGPRTMIHCFLHATVFALAIEVAVRVQMFPSAASPLSNLLMHNQQGHLVGLERVNTSSGFVREIGSCFKDLPWQSGYVLLARVYESMAEVNSAVPKIGGADPIRRRFFQQAGKNVTILTRDIRAVECLRVGIPELREYLVRTIGGTAADDAAEIDNAIERTVTREVG